MATVLIDKLLHAAIKQGVSDIHIVVGQPPVFRLHGRMRKLETKTLEGEDAVALMKSITPERCQRELQESGSTDFGFAFGHGTIVVHSTQRFNDDGQAFATATL